MAASSRYLSRRESGRRHEIVTPEGIPLGFTLASAGERMSAFLLDALILLAVWIVFVLLMGAGLGDVATAIVVVAEFLIVTFYFCWFELRWRGASPGKRVVGLRVIGRDGGPLSADAVVVRNLMREVEFFMPLVVLLFPEQLWPGARWYVPLLASLWLLVFAFMPLFNKERLRIGDMVAGTIVVLAPKSVLLPDIGGVEVARARQEAASYRFSPEQLAVYGVYELQVLEKVLRGHDAFDRQVAIMSVCERIKAKIGWDAQRWNVAPERFLREFYAALRFHLESKMLLGKRRADKYDQK